MKNTEYKIYSIDNTKQFEIIKNHFEKSKIAMVYFELYQIFRFSKNKTNIELKKELFQFIDKIKKVNFETFKTEITTKQAISNIAYLCYYFVSRLINHSAKFDRLSLRVNKILNFEPNI